MLHIVYAALSLHMNIGNVHSSDELYALGRKVRVIIK